MTEKSLYDRLGGYDSITTFVHDLLDRLQADSQLGRFWQHRGDDGIAREKQLLIDYLAASAGGPLLYTGREMLASHVGMKIDDSDWNVFLGHAGATMESLKIPQQERDDIVAFVLTLQSDIVDS